MVWFSADQARWGLSFSIFLFVLVLCNRAHCFHELHAAYPHRLPAAATLPPRIV